MPTDQTTGSKSPTHLALPGARSALVLLLLINLFNYIDRQVLATVVDFIQGMERQFHDPEFTRRYGGLIVAHLPVPWIYDGAQTPLEPRAFFLLWRSSLIRVSGLFVGTGKIGEFIPNRLNF